MADYRNELIGTSPALDALRGLIDKVGRSPTRTVLIYGETGTGKELLAHAIHAASRRGDGPLIGLRGPAHNNLRAFACFLPHGAGVAGQRRRAGKTFRRLHLRAESR